MSELERLGASILDPLQALSVEIVAFLPNLIAAVLLLLLGYALARFLRYLVEKLARGVGLDGFADAIGVQGFLDRLRAGLTLTAVVGFLVFWFVFLIFFLSAADALELPRFSAAIDHVVRFLPNVLGALAIVIAGLYVGQIVRDLIVRQSTDAGIEYGRALGSAFHLVTILVAASLAIGQLNVDTGLLNQIVVTVLVTFGAAAAIALGMGGRDVAANVMAGIYLRALLETDREIECGDVEGTLAAITAVKSIIVCGDERVTIPNRELLNGVTRIKAITRRS